MARCISAHISVTIAVIMVNYKYRSYRNNESKTDYSTFVLFNINIGLKCSVCALKVLPQVSNFESRHYFLFHVKKTDSLLPLFYNMNFYIS